jgi:dihydroorotate dehydrogenase
MPFSFYRALRPALFCMPPELAHRTALKALAHYPSILSKPAPSLKTTMAGLSLPSPIGLAAGFDKNAEAFGGALRAGFGFVEVGTLTPKPQLGNPRPRVFRLPHAEAIINRLGFNNDGLDAAVARLKQRHDHGIIGGNIGKNKDTEDAVADYVSGVYALYPYVDYLTVNISSPNTPGLRDLQTGDALRALVLAVQEARALEIARGMPRKPIFVKIAPDNTDAALDAIAHVALEMAVDGLIVSNTTIARDHVNHLPHGGEAGGLSGKPLMLLSTRVLHGMYARTEGNIPLIGVGGIASAEDAYTKIRAGASAVQLYTALVYQGVGMVVRMNRELAALLARDGFASVHDAVGAAHR